MKHFMVVAFAAGAMLLGVGSVMAQDSTQRDRHEVFDFEGTEIHGTIEKPTGTHIKVRPISRFSPMVFPRANFWFEMEASGGDV